MTQYLIRRLLWAMVLFVAVTLVTYIIFYIVPADPARLVAGRAATTADVKRVAHLLGTDQPIYIQYLRFLKRLVIDHSLGFSYASRESINTIVLSASRVTFSLVLGGAILWMIISVPIGILSALRPRSILDRVAMIAVLIGISAHPVWIGYIFSYFFGFRLGWTPISGYCTFVYQGSGQCGGPTQWAYHLILPWMTFAILFAALYVRMIRANVMETMGEDYVRTARAKGAPEAIVMRRHVLRNALLPVVTMLGMDIAIALGGAIFTETVYGLPGLGKTAIQGLNTYDLPVTQGVVVFASICVILFNLIVDILYAYIDPRIKLS